MAYKIVWTKTAKESFDEEIAFLYKKWNPAIVERFLNLTDHLIQTISETPFLFKKYATDNTVRRGLIHHNVTMFYRIRQEKNRVEILLFWNNLRNPQKLKI